MNKKEEEEIILSARLALAYKYGQTGRCADAYLALNPNTHPSVRIDISTLLRQWDDHNKRMNDRFIERAMIKNRV